MCVWKCALFVSLWLYGYFFFCEGETADLAGLLEAKLLLHFDLLPGVLFDHKIPISFIEITVSA